MPRPKAVNPKLEKKLHLDAELVAKAELQLFSDLEGRVPYGAWSGYIEQLMREAQQRQQRAEALAKALQHIAHKSPEDPEGWHVEADRLLLTELTALGYDVSAFHRIKRYYA